jgi:hypothetical protein
MRKPLLISMLLLHILGNTELCQLLSVHKIYQHYQLHLLMNPQEGFVDYISEHYVGDDGINADDAMDHELPFKNLIHQSNLPATTPPLVFSTTLYSYFLNRIPFPLGIPEAILSPYKDSLLRPPATMA